MIHKYNHGTLKRLQNTQLDILKDFIDVCEKNQLNYFIIFGTAIGAERHKGFIPWDDDIDIGMLRKDYEKFILIANEKLNHKYRILTPNVDENYTCTVTHLQKKNTRFISHNSKNIKCELCIDIDIFVFDNISDNPKERKNQLKKTWFLGRLLFLRGTPNPVIPFKGLKGRFVKGVCRVIYYILALIGLSSRKIYSSFLNESKKFNNIKTKSVTTFEDPVANKCIINIEDIFPLKRIQFEDINVNIPNNNKKILTQIYGDFMKMPSEQERVNHCPYILDFGEGDVINEGNV